MDKGLFCFKAYLLIIGLVAAPLYGQLHQTDSLKQLLPKLKGKEKAEVLSTLTWQLKYSSPKSAIQFGNESVDIARSLGDKEQLSAALLNLSVVYSIKADYDSSNAKVLKALDVFQSMENLTGMAKCWNVLGLNEQARGNYDLALNYFLKSREQFSIIGNQEYVLSVEANIGNVNYHLGRYDSALYAYQRMVDYSRENSKYTTLANNLMNIGSTYSELGDYPKALRALFESKDTWESQGDSVGIANVLNEIGVIFNYIEMYERAKETLYQAIHINTDLGNKRQIAMNCNNIALSYKNTNELDSALHYYQKALSNYEDVGVKTSGLIIGNIGSLYLKKEMYDSAELYFNRAISINTELGKEDDKAQNVANLANLNLIYGNLEESERLFLEAYSYWSKENKYKEVAFAAKGLVDVYKAVGEFESATKFQDILLQARDSVFGHQKRNELTQILVEELLKKEIEGMPANNSADSKASDRLIYYTVFGALAVVLLLLVSWFWYKSVRAKERIQHDLDQKNRELSFLSLSVMQKDEFIKNFMSQLQGFTKKESPSKDIQKLLKNLKMHQIESNHWNNFKEAFEHIAPQFFDELLRRYPKLTNKELRLCSLVRLNIPANEISKILGISVSSVHKARYRLRKRFNLEGQNSLEVFLSSI